MSLCTFKVRFLKCLKNVKKNFKQNKHFQINVSFFKYMDLLGSQMSFVERRTISNEIKSFGKYRADAFTALHISQACEEGFPQGRPTVKVILRMLAIYAMP